MKPTKRILSIFLTLAMTLSLLVVLPVTVSADADPDSFSEDFENLSIGDQLTGGNSPLTFSDNGGGTLTVAEEGGNKYLKYTGDGSGKHVILHPDDNFSAVKYTVTFDLRFDSIALASQYYGVYAAADSADCTANGIQLLRWASNPADCVRVGTVTDNADDRAVHTFPLNTWLTVQMIRNDTDFVIRVREKGATVDYITYATAIANLGATAPGFLFLNFSVATAIVSLDNFTCKAGADAWQGEFDGFENQTAEADFNSEISVFSKAEQSASQIAEENSNKYLLYTTTAAGSDRYYFSELKGADTYSIRADIRFQGDTISSGPTKGSMVLYILADYTDYTAASGFWIGNRYGTKGIIAPASAVPYTYTNAFGLDTWYSIELTRSGNSLSFTLWEKGTAQPLTPTISITLEEKDSVMPGFRLRCENNTYASSELTISMDNINVVRGDESNAVKIGGFQGGTVADGKYAVRFIGGIDSRNYTSAKFTVTATYNSGENQKVFYTPGSCEVYDSILANTPRGIVRYEAGDLGANYLTALNIYNIPVSAGEIIFHVCFTATKSNGTTVTAFYQFTIGVVDGAVVPV